MENTKTEFYYQVENFQKVDLELLLNDAIEHFGQGTTIDDLFISSERFLERGCSCCGRTDDDYDTYLCVTKRG